jgi:hypothetical protein
MSIRYGNDIHRGLRGRHPAEERGRAPEVAATMPSSGRRHALSPDNFARPRTQAARNQSARGPTAPLTRSSSGVKGTGENLRIFNVGPQSERGGDDRVHESWLDNSLSMDLQKLGQHAVDIHLHLKHIPSSRGHMRWDAAALIGRPSEGGKHLLDERSRLLRGLSRGT